MDPNGEDTDIGHECISEDFLESVKQILKEVS